ncbi:MAG: EF-P beta-lysylation protein EpmB [Planctomycetes bacterium]|nr:EF-P beta-lysylation protein EpmB [Planctomycetota bacterium]
MANWPARAAGNPTASAPRRNVPPQCEPPLPSWHESLASAIRNPATLLQRLYLSTSLLESADLAAHQFPVMVPESYLARMRPGDINDPLLRQVLPLGDELLETPGFVRDAVDDEASRIAPGLLKKYAGRALMILTGACAVHCRYCFRRHYPYANEPRRLPDWEPAIQALTADTTIHEVLLSGGDPLMVTDLRLKELCDRLEQIPHIQRLRIHSRLPIVLPNRVTDELLDLLTATRLTPLMVVHANHPREITGDCADALRRLVRSGMTTLNQSVLLRGINDSVDTLKKLSERLINLGVIPYYLHQLDRVQGAAHFEVDEATGLSLIEALQRQLPGYGVPQYVREVAGAPAKQPVGIESTL